MAQWFFPFQDVGGDREYSDSDFSLFYQHLFTNGVFINVGKGLQVQAMKTPAMQVQIAIGAAHINGRQFMNTDVVVLDVPVASSTQDRVDSVVLRLDLSNRIISLEYKTGDIKVTRNEFVWELQLATVKVTKNSSVIKEASITDTRANDSVCGYSSPFEKVDVSGLEDQYAGMLADIYKEVQNKLNDIINEATNTAADSKNKQHDALQDMYDSFQRWFDNIQTDLGGDVGSDLQNQINSLKPNVDLGVIFKHNFNGYPRVQAWYWEYGLGMVGLGTEPDGYFGGSNVELINIKVEYVDVSGFKIYVPQEKQMLSPDVEKRSEYEYLVTQGHRSMIVKFEEYGFQY